MYTFTISAGTAAELAEKMLASVAEFDLPHVNPMPKPKKATKAVEPEPVAEDEVDRELMAEVEPMPDTAKAVVDAGTGKPVAAETVKMTFEDVKVAAAKLAAKDTPKLVEILTKFKAANLSGVPKDKLGEFAGLVMAELEGPLG